MQIDGWYQNGKYDSGTTLKNILSQISSEFQQLGDPLNEYTSNTQNELLSEMRDITKKISKPKPKINIIDETLIIESKNTQEFYKQNLAITNQKKTPKRIIKMKQYISLKDTLQKQEKQTNIMSDFQQQTVEQILTGNILQDTSKEFLSKNKNLYFKSFKEYAINQVQTIKLQLLDIKKEIKQLTSNPNNQKSSMKVNEFKKQLLITKLRDNLIQKQFFKKLQYQYQYKKVIIQQLEQLHKAQGLTLQKIIFTYLIKKQRQSREKKLFLKELKQHLSYFKIKQVFAGIKQCFISSKAQQKVLLKIIIKAYLKKWFHVIQFKKNTEKVLHKLLVFVPKIAKIQTKILLLGAMNTIKGEIKYDRILKNFSKEQKEKLFKIWKQYSQIKKLRAVIKEVAVFKKLQLIFKLWKKNFNAPRVLNLKKYIFKVWKKIPHENINQLISDNFRRSSLIVKNFQYWVRVYKQRKALKVLEKIFPKNMKKQSFNYWRKTSNIEGRQNSLFKRMKLERIKFKVFYFLKQKFQEMRQKKMRCLRKYFSGWRQQSIKSSNFTKRFQYFWRLKLSFKKMFINAKLTRVKQKVNKILKSVNIQKQNLELAKIFNSIRSYSSQRRQKKIFYKKVEQKYQKKIKIQVFSILSRYQRNRRRKHDMIQQGQKISSNRQIDMQYLFFDCWRKATAHKQIQLILEKKADQIYLLKMKKRVFNMIKIKGLKVHFQQEYEQNWQLYRQFSWQQ